MKKIICIVLAALIVLSLGAFAEETVFDASKVKGNDISFKERAGTDYDPSSDAFLAAFETLLAPLDESGVAGIVEDGGAYIVTMADRASFAVGLSQDKKGVRLTISGGIEAGKDPYDANDAAFVAAVNYLLSPAGRTVTMLIPSGAGYNLMTGDGSIYALNVSKEDGLLTLVIELM